MLEICILFAAALIAAAVMWPRCLLAPCRWIFYGNVVSGPTTRWGLYQCSRCKTISAGSER